MKNEVNTEQKSVEAVYTNIKSSLMRFAFRYLKKPNDIEDIVQEAFVRVINVKKNTEVKHLKSYLFQTVRNLSFKHIGKLEYKLSNSVGDFADESVLLSTQSLEEQFESRQRFELFCRAVRVLPVKCQRAYILRKVYGYSQKEIAQHMGISIKTVEAHLTKAIIRCTDYMDDYENKGSIVNKKQKVANMK